jgi:phospholipid/cholesterol/gamma-HCH transport system substrate-binding protein
MRKDCVAREMSMEIIVGSFMVMVLLGLAYFTIILSREAIFSKSYGIEIVFDKVMGLRNGDSIVVRGMPVGKVSALRLEGDGVHVVGSLEAEVNVRAGYKMTIVQSSVLGGRHLNIDGGPSDGALLKPDTAFLGTTPHDLISDAGEVMSSLRTSLVDGRAIDKISLAADNLYQISERLNTGQGTLGKLLSEDDTIYNDVAASVASLRSLSGRLESGQGTLGHLMADDDQLYNDLSATVASLKIVAQRLENGEGLLGKMMTDDQLYNQLSGIISEAMEVLDDYRETSPVVTFTSIFFGAL